MNKMSDVIGKFLLVSSVALAMPMAAFASDGKSEGGHHDGQEQMHDERHGEEGYEGKKGHGYFKGLDLSEEQREQIKEMMKAHRQKMRAEHEAFMKQVDEVLTPEQREKAREMRAKRAEMYRERMQERKSKE